MANKIADDSGGATVDVAVKNSEAHIWRFFRAGGFDQVKIDRGSDIASLSTLDQKLWGALACPTRGVEFDERTLSFIDSDKDGRIRVPEMLEAVDWIMAILKDCRYLEQPGDELPLTAINIETERGRAIFESAKLILTMLGKPERPSICLGDAIDVERIFSATPFNGDGIITLSSAEDEETAAAIKDIMDCLGTETDRSHQLGISQALADRFFAEAANLKAWHKESDVLRRSLLPFGDRLEAAACLVEELRVKIDDYFARVRLSEVDARAASALNPALSTYETMAGVTLKREDSAIASLPLAWVEAGKPLQLDHAVNPAWSDKVRKFREDVVGPLLGARDKITEEDWDEIKQTFSAYAAWAKRKPETSVAKITFARLESLLAPSVKHRIDALIDRDTALKPQMDAIADVEKLLRIKRDLMTLLNNFASFRDFYTRSVKAVFQAGTLYLDGRSCDLCVKVDNEARHAELATLSRIYLAYCRCTRGADVMTIAAAFTAGNAKNLRVGRNGVFYDRKGDDWDATIIRIVEHPISLRQAFWLPYVQFFRFISEQVQKFAAARAAAQQASMAQATVRTTAGATGPQPTPTAQQQTFDAARFAGIFAAIGLAIGAIGTAIASIMTGFLQLAWWQMPLVILAIVLIISGPSCLIAFIKLRNRNLGPILDACGWAVNTQLRINLPFGRALTATAALPKEAERVLSDPYAEKQQPWLLYAAIALGVLAFIIAWRTGYSWPPF